MTSAVKVATKIHSVTERRKDAKHKESGMEKRGCNFCGRKICYLSSWMSYVNLAIVGVGIVTVVAGAIFIAFSWWGIAVVGVGIFIIVPACVNFYYVDTYVAQASIKGSLDRWADNIIAQEGANRGIKTNVKEIVKQNRDLTKQVERLQKTHGKIAKDQQRLNKKTEKEIDELEEELKDFSKNTDLRKQTAQIDASLQDMKAIRKEAEIQHNQLQVALKKAENNGLGEQIQEIRKLVEGYQQTNKKLIEGAKKFKRQQAEMTAVAEEINELLDRVPAYIERVDKTREVMDKNTKKMREYADVVVKSRKVGTEIRQLEQQLGQIPLSAWDIVEKEDTDDDVNWSEDNSYIG